MDKKKVQKILKRVNPDLRTELKLDDNVLIKLTGTTPEVISDEERQELDILIGAKRIDKLLDLIKLSQVAVYFQFMGVLEEADRDLYAMVKAVENDVLGTPTVRPDQSGPIPRPLVAASQVVTDEDVLDILEIFNIAKLHAVYIRLGLNQMEIDNVTMAYNSPPVNATLVLNLWRNKKSEAATRDNLFVAMAKVSECKAFMDNLKKKWGYPL